MARESDARMIIIGIALASALAALIGAGNETEGYGSR